jgi:succinate dehydrogenase / fumarate reductase cytochrome b subunit
LHIILVSIVLAGYTRHVADRRIDTKRDASGVRLRHSILVVEKDMNKTRPKHLALHKIKLPLAGYVSILHRVSGAILFLALPLLLAMLDQSLRSIETFTNLAEYLDHALAKLMMVGLMWAFLHHFCAGLRYLAIDLHLVHGLSGARASSRWVMVVSLVVTVVLGVKIW